MNNRNFINGIEHRLYNFRRLVGENIQVFNYHSIGNLDVSSIPEIADLNLEPADPEYISFLYGGSAEKLRVHVKVITRDSKGEEMSFSINNIKASEMRGCGRSFKIPQQRSTCYLKLFIIDEETGQEIKEDTVYLQDVQESRVAVEMADQSTVPRPREENSIFDRMLNWVTGGL